MSDISSVALDVQTESAAIGTQLQASPIKNEQLSELISAVSASAGEAAAVASGNPVTIATSTVGLLTELAPLGTDALNLFKNLAAFFSKHKKTTPPPATPPVTETPVNPS